MSLAVFLPSARSHCLIFGIVLRPVEQNLRILLRLYLRRVAFYCLQLRGVNLGAGTAFPL